MIDLVDGSDNDCDDGEDDDDDDFANAPMSRPKARPPRLQQGKKKPASAFFQPFPAHAAPSAAPPAAIVPSASHVSATPVEAMRAAVDRVAHRAMALSASMDRALPTHHSHNNHHHRTTMPRRPPAVTPAAVGDGALGGWRDAVTAGLSGMAGLGSSLEEEARLRQQLQRLRSSRCHPSPPVPIAAPAVDPSAAAAGVTSARAAAAWLQVLVGAALAVDDVMLRAAARLGLAEQLTAQWAGAGAGAEHTAGNNDDDGDGDGDGDDDVMIVDPPAWAASSSHPRQRQAQAAPPAAPATHAAQSQQPPDLAFTLSLSRLGAAVVLRADGCTLRDGVDIDDSAPLGFRLAQYEGAALIVQRMRLPFAVPLRLPSSCPWHALTSFLPHLAVVYFDQAVLVPAIPSETTDVVRVHVVWAGPPTATADPYTGPQGLRAMDAWASVTGRVPGVDTAPLLDIRRWPADPVAPALPPPAPAIAATRPPQQPPLLQLPPPQQPLPVAPSSSSSRPALRACPICDASFAGLAPQMVDAHMFACLT